MKPRTISEQPVATARKDHVIRNDNFVLTRWSRGLAEVIVPEVITWVEELLLYNGQVGVS